MKIRYNGIKLTIKMKTRYKVNNKASAFFTFLKKYLKKRRTFVKKKPVCKTGTAYTSCITYRYIYYTLYTLYLKHRKASIQSCQVYISCICVCIYIYTTVCKTCNFLPILKSQFSILITLPFYAYSQTLGV